MIKIAWDASYALSLPEGHRFPMLKYELIPQQLLHEGCIEEANLFIPTLCSYDIISLCHSKEYIYKLKSLTFSESEMRRIGFPLTPQLIERERRIIQGTIDCALYALQYGVSLNVAGGTHHAATSVGEGFCILNDFAVATSFLLYHQICKKIAIIDLDVHQGNGTAEIFNNNPSVYTLSFHGKENYPLHKPHSNLDIELETGSSDSTYLNLMHQHIPEMLDTFKPDLVCYQSGVDILETDRYGKLKISASACKQRDRLVFEWCKERSIPVAVAMGGGYSPKISDIVNAHCETFRQAVSVFF